MRHIALGVLSLLLPSALGAGGPGTFDEVANTQVSAMMMFLGNKDRVYILDKAQGNAAQISGHSAWGSVYDIATHQVTLLDIQTNTFCSSGAHLPNGSFAVFGGNSAVAIGGGASSGTGWDSTLQDFDGSKAIRILNPCTADVDLSSAQCQWVEDTADPAMSMQAQRWYSTAEALANGTIVLMGGFTGGGYVLRNVPNTDPTAGASLTYEFFPTNGVAPTNLQFLFKTSGLNSYPHAFLMASGKMFLQANLSTTLWDYNTNQEQDLPAMPNGVIRVYPGSGATAMLPMTPANNWQQTVIFCGGNDMPEPDWGNFGSPFANTWELPASTDCQRITPEPSDGSAAAYQQDDPMLEGRTMGQFIILPNGKLLVVNGGLNGTAGYGRNNSLTPEDEMPFGQSYASGPVGTPALYDPNATSGSRWSRSGYSNSKIARLYHSSALLLPDGAVLIAGSNPNLDVNISKSIPFPTTYTAEKFYPDYFWAATRPSPSGVPSSLTYGGASFDITVPASSYAGKGNDAAASAQVNVIRPGWTTHGMNMGQRFLQLNSTYTVNSDSSLTLHVAQMPPNPNIFQPGPALLFVVINGIPSTGTDVLIGSGIIEAQPASAIANLPQNILSSSAVGTAKMTKSIWTIGVIAAVAGGGAALALIGLGLGICLARRRRARIRRSIALGKAAQAQKFSDAKQGPPPNGVSPYPQYQQQYPQQRQQQQSAFSDNASQVFLAGGESQVWGPPTRTGTPGQFQPPSRTGTPAQYQHNAYRDSEPDLMLQAPQTHAPPPMSTHYYQASQSSFDSMGSSGRHQPYGAFPQPPQQQGPRY